MLPRLLEDVAQGRVPRTRTYPKTSGSATALGRYFPQALREAYAGVMPRHPLRREIVATHVVNSMVNRVGSTFVHRLMETTGAHAPEIVRAYLLQREIFGYVPLWQSIEALDNKVPDQIQSEMLIEAGRLTVRATSWFLRSRRLAEPMEQTIERFQPGVETLYAELPRLLDAQARSQLDIQAVRWTQAGVPREIAARVAALDTLFAALDIVEVADATARAVPTVAGVYFEVSSKLGIAWLRDRIGQIPGDEPLAGAREELDARRPRGARAHARRQRARGGRRPTNPPRSSPTGSARIATRWTAPRASSASCGRRPRRTWRCSRWVCGSSGTSRDEVTGRPELATLRAAGSRRTARNVARAAQGARRRTSQRREPRRQRARLESRLSLPPRW